jgi:hypothetical protein
VVQAARCFTYADVANNPVSVHDLHATMLQLCERLTGVEQA